MAATSIDLDHIALAAELAWDNFDRYRGDLGGAWNGGMYNPGFYWGQVKFANGMVVEMLQPAQVHLDDFLRRFIDRNGDGPHHMTFKVPDIVTAMDAATAAGFPPVRSDLSQPEWKEAFLHPKQCHGIVVQLAQSSEHEWDDEVHHHVLPPARLATPATFDRIVHAVLDLDGALALFRDLLQGAETARGVDSDGNEFVDLAWPGPGRVRLVHAVAPEWVEWIGERPGRVHHLEFTRPDPALVLDAVSRGDGTYEIAPERNRGVRLWLRAAP